MPDRCHPAIIKRAAFALASVGLGAAAARAEPPQQLSDLPPAARAAVTDAWASCNADIGQYCPGVQPGGGRIVRCLASNKEKLSPACLAGMVKARAALGL